MISAHMAINVQEPHEMSALIDTHTRKLCAQLLGAMMRGEGTIRISVCERAIERYAAMALMKRSPKMTAN